MTIHHKISTSVSAQLCIIIYNHDFWHCFYIICFGRLRSRARKGRQVDTGLDKIPGVLEFAKGAEYGIKVMEQ